MSSDNVSQIKDRLSIVDVVGSYLKLQKAGANLKAPCPFHNEKTPSFFVSPDRGTFKCFGCGEGGDIFTFVEKFEGVDFYGAMKILAEKAGVELKKEDPQQVDARKKLYSIIEETTLFFEQNLQDRHDALKYLKNRGLDDETIKKFRIGFVRDEWQSIYNFLKSKNYSDEEIEKAGLVKKKDGTSRYYDRFRSRIIFPLFDSSGRVVAFSGRIFGEDANNSEVAKYLNSPETDIFHKSKVLFGYNFAKTDIRKRDFSILVEGQMDIIMAHQAGFTNTVATSGTALTPDHLTLLRRLSNKVMMAFDGDEAGLRAANKGAKLALIDGMEVKLIEIPEGMDPADFVLKDKNGWIDALKNAVHIVEFNLNVLLQKGLDQRRLGIEIKNIVLPLVTGIKSKIEQDYFVSHIAEKAGVTEDSVREELLSVEKNGDTSYSNIQQQSQEINTKNRKQKVVREIAGILHWQKNHKKPTVDIEKIEKRLENDLGTDILEKILTLPEGVKNDIIFEAESLYTDDLGIQEKVDELFSHLEVEMLIEDRKEIELKIAGGEDTKENLKKYDQISKKIESLK